MIRKLVLAVVVAIVVSLVCTLLGSILESLQIGIAVAVGAFLHTYSAVLGILAGLWYYFAGSLSL